MPQLEPLQITREGMPSENNVQARVEWPAGAPGDYSSYEFIYWHIDSATNKRTIPAKTNTALVAPVLSNQLYSYQVKYFCPAGSFLTPVRSFRLLDGDPVIIDPATGNCFPPLPQASSLVVKHTRVEN